MANKKIIVVKLREIIYTGIFLFFGIVLILLLVAMFAGSEKETKSDHTAPPSSEDSAEPSSGAETMAIATASTASNVLSYSDYRPGIYCADLNLSGTTYSLQVILDPSGIRDLSLLPLSATDSASGDFSTGKDGNNDSYIATMYPLMEPVLTQIEEALQNNTALSDITFEAESRYTGSLLTTRLQSVLNKALTKSVP